MSTKPSAAKYAGAARRADAIEAELRRLGRWRAEPLPPEAFRFTQPFAADTMPLEHWLQFIFLPRVREIVSASGEFPPRSQVGTYARRNFDGDDDADGLVRLLCGFDEYIVGDGSEPAPPLDAGGHAPPPAGDPFEQALAEFRQKELPRELHSIAEGLGKEVALEIDWSTVGVGLAGDERLRAARQWLGSRAVGDVRSALRLLSSNYGQDAARAVADVLHTVRLRFVAEGEPTHCRFADGVLDVVMCLKTQYVRNFEIGRVLADALQLRIRPLIKELAETTVPEHAARLSEQLDCPISVEVDFDSFTAEPDVDAQLSALRDGAREGVYHLCYAVGAVGGKPEHRPAVRSRVTALRIRHTPNPCARELSAVGSTLVLTGRFGAGWGGYLSEDEIERVLPGVVAGMPAPTFAPSARSAEQRLAECRRIAAACQGRISGAVGGPVNLEIDWDAVRADPAAIAGLAGRALQRVTGAILLLEPVLKASNHPGKPTTISITTADEPGDRECRPAGGVLHLRVCPAPPPPPQDKDAREPATGFFYEWEIAKVLSDTLALETTPLVAGLQEEMIPRFARWMNENLRSAITVQVEWDGFLTHADVEKNKYAVNRLEQDGLNNIYYALSGLAEKSEEMARMIRRRVRVLRVRHVDSPAQKALLAEGNELICRIHLHEGYDGRLTIDEMKKLLPGLLLEMADGPDPSESPAVDADEGRDSDAGDGDERDESDADESQDEQGSEPVDTRMMVLHGLIDAGIHHLEQNAVQTFLMMFMAPDLLMKLWSDGGAAFQKLTADFGPRRDLFLWAFRKCRTMTPDLDGDRATFRFQDLPPGVTIEPLVFKEAEGRWLLDIFNVKED